MVLTTHGWVFVRTVAAVVTAVAPVPHGCAEIVVALEQRRQAVLSTRVSRWAANFIAHVSTVSGTVATQIGRYAMATGALERVVLCKNIEQKL